MKPSLAIKVVKQWRRYRKGYRGKSVWCQAGGFVPQKLIPVTPAEVTAVVDRIMVRGSKTTSVEQDVPLSRVWSFQHSLRLRSLLFQIEQFRNSQRGWYCTTEGTVRVKRATELPVFFYYAGKYVVWNGNHRCTAALLLGETKIRGRVYRPRRRRRSNNG